MDYQAPWKLCSSEMDREFQILDAAGTPLAKVLMVNSAVTPWANKKLSAKELWHQLTNEPERTKTTLMVMAPEIMQQLKKAHRFLRKSGYDMTEIDALINQIEG